MKILTWLTMKSVPAYILSNELETVFYEYLNTFVMYYQLQ